METAYINDDYEYEQSIGLIHRVLERCGGGNLCEGMAGTMGHEFYCEECGTGWEQAC